MENIKKYLRITPIDIEKLETPCITLLHCTKAYIEHEGTDAEDSAEIGDVCVGMPNYIKNNEFHDAYHVHVLSRATELNDGEICHHPDFGIQPVCDMRGDGMDEWYEMGWRKLIYSSDPYVQAFGVDTITLRNMEDIAEVFTTEDF